MDAFHWEPPTVNSSHPPRVWARCHKHTRFEEALSRRRPWIGPSIGHTTCVDVASDLAGTGHVKHAGYEGLLPLTKFARSLSNLTRTSSGGCHKWQPHDNRVRMWLLATPVIFQIFHFQKKSSRTFFLFSKVALLLYILLIYNDNFGFFCRKNKVWILKKCVARAFKPMISYS